jgi:SPP1 gp7 family putative phage head morphogenesis protein
MKKICPLCETENDENARFCKECNEPLYSLSNEYEDGKDWIPDNDKITEEGIKITIIKGIRLPSPVTYPIFGLTREQKEIMAFILDNYLSDSRILEREFIALLLGGKWEWPDFDKWHQKFTELSYFPYMWSSVQIRPTEEIPEAAQILNTFGTLSINARRLLVGNNGISNYNQITRAIEDMGREVGIMKNETLKIIEELKQFNLAEYPLKIGEKINILKVDDLKEICEEYNLPKTGKKSDLIQTISQNVSEKDLISFIPSYAQRDTARIGFSLPLRIRNYINWNIAKIKLLTHTLQSLFDTLESIENDKQMDVKNIQIIGVREDPCPICALHNGKIFNIIDTDFNMLPPFHPGCRCCIAPYIRLM